VNVRALVTMRAGHRCPYGPSTERFGRRCLCATPGWPGRPCRPRRSSGMGRASPHSQHPRAGVRRRFFRRRTSGRRFRLLALAWQSGRAGNPAWWRLLGKEEVSGPQRSPEYKYVERLLMTSLHQLSQMFFIQRFLGLRCGSPSVDAKFRVTKCWDRIVRARVWRRCCGFHVVASIRPRNWSRSRRPVARAAGWPTAVTSASAEPMTRTCSSARVTAV
jgi:hypothetical protein